MTRKGFTHLSISREHLVQQHRRRLDNFQASVRNKTAIKTKDGRLRRLVASHQLSPRLSQRKRKKKPSVFRNRKKASQYPRLASTAGFFFPISSQDSSPHSQSPQPFASQILPRGLRPKSRDLGEWELGGLRHNGSGERGLVDWKRGNKMRGGAFLHCSSGTYVCTVQRSKGGGGRPLHLFSWLSIAGLLLGFGD
jgi:hypothetical protein